MRPAAGSRSRCGAGHRHQSARARPNTRLNLATVGKNGDRMFEYFPNHYSWSSAALMAVQLGGELSEVDEACRPLLEAAKLPDARNNPLAQKHWVDRWSALARKVETLAKVDERADHPLSAGRKYRRAAVYFMTAERMASRHSPE